MLPPNASIFMFPCLVLPVFPRRPSMYGHIYMHMSLLDSEFASEPFLSGTSGHRMCCLLG